MTGCGGLTWAIYFTCSALLNYKKGLHEHEAFFYGFNRHYLIVTQIPPKKKRKIVFTKFQSARKARCKKADFAMPEPGYKGLAAARKQRAMRNADFTLHAERAVCGLIAACREREAGNASKGQTQITSETLRVAC